MPHNNLNNFPTKYRIGTHLILVKYITIWHLKRQFIAIVFFCMNIYNAKMFWFALRFLNWEKKKKKRENRLQMTRWDGNHWNKYLSSPLCTAINGKHKLSIFHWFFYPFNFYHCETDEKAVKRRQNNRNDCILISKINRNTKPSWTNKNQWHWTTAIHFECIFCNTYSAHWFNFVQRFCFMLFFSLFISHHTQLPICLIVCNW